MSEKSTIIQSDELCIKICEGLKIDYSLVSRVILDLKAGEPIRVYIAMFGDENLLSINFDALQEIAVIQKVDA